MNISDNKPTLSVKGILVDESGKVVNTKEYDFGWTDDDCSHWDDDICLFFSDGLAAYKLNGKYGYIDKSGVSKIPPVYDEADSFLKIHLLWEWWFK